METSIRITDPRNGTLSLMAAGRDAIPQSPPAKRPCTSSGTLLLQAAQAGPGVAGME
jgi:hypothetical protein